MVQVALFISAFVGIIEARATGDEHWWVWLILVIVSALIVAGFAVLVERKARRSGRRP